MPNYRVDPRIRTRKLLFGDPRGRQRETLWIGAVAELGLTQVPVWFDISVEHVVAVVGKRGSGKSFTLGVLIEGLSPEASASSLSTLVPTHATLLLDSLNIYWPSVHQIPEHAPADGPIGEQIRLLKKWKMQPESIRADLWAPAGFEPSFLDVPAQPFRFSVGSLTADDWGDLFGVDTIRDPIGRAVGEAQRSVTVTGWRAGDGDHHAPRSDPDLEDLIQNLETNREIVKDYASETIRAAVQRFRAISAYGVFARQGSALEDILTPGRTSILMLGAVPDDLRSVFVGVLARRMLAERAEVSGRAKRAVLLGQQDDGGEGIPPTWLLIDEAQNFLPSGKNTSATQALVRFVREGRNYGLSFVVTSQQPSAIDSKIMAQVDTLIAHQLVTGRDVSTVVDNIKCPFPTSIRFGSEKLRFAEAVAQLDVGQAIVSAPELQRATFVAIRPRVTLHGGFEA